MKHIETKSKAETEARTKYAKATDGITVASDDIAAKVSELLGLRKKMDEDELRKSQLMGEIMEAMKTATVLKHKNGNVIVTWKKASSKVKINYKGLLKHLKATEKDILAYTKQELGARTFEIIEDQAECAEMVKEIEANLANLANLAKKEEKPEQK